MKRKNKITKGTLCNSIAIHKPVTLAEWEKVRGKQSKPKGEWVVTKPWPEAKEAIDRYFFGTTTTATITTPVTIPADPTDEQVLERALLNLKGFEVKFRDGMTKYTTPIYHKSGLKEMTQELYDFISYHTLAQLQWSEVSSLLDSFVRDYPHHEKDPRIKRMFTLLGDKPLAVKKNTSKEYMPGVWYTTDGSNPKPVKKKNTKKKK